MCAPRWFQRTSRLSKRPIGGMCLDLLDRLEKEPESFSRVITGDVLWILEYYPQTKRQSREWHTANSPRHKKARMSKSKIKSMFIFFWLSWDRPKGITVKLFIGNSLKDSEKGWHVCDEALHAQRQRPMSHGSLRRWIFGRKKAFPWFLSPLFAGSQSPWLLFIPPAQKPLEMAPFCTLDNIQKSVTDKLIGIPA